MYFEGWDFFTALYVSIITVSTVGYGDITPITFEGKVLTLVYIICGAGAMAYTFASIADFFIEGQFKKVLRLKKMKIFQMMYIFFHQQVHWTILIL